MSNTNKKAGVSITFKDKTCQMFNTESTIQQLKDKIEMLLDNGKSHIGFPKGKGVVYIPLSELKDATIEIK